MATWKGSRRCRRRAPDMACGALAKAFQQLQRLEAGCERAA
jgi:hypothetical protein